MARDPNCEACNPCCGCGECGECLSGIYPRCWEHDRPPISNWLCGQAIKELTETLGHYVANELLWERSCKWLEGFFLRHGYHVRVEWEHYMTHRARFLVHDLDAETVITTTWV